MQGFDPSIVVSVQGILVQPKRQREMSGGFSYFED